MPGYNEMCELEWCEEIKIVIFMARVNRSHLRAAQTVIIHASLISLTLSIFVLAVIVTLSSQGPSFCSSQDPDVARTIIMIIIIITITNTIT